MRRHGAALAIGASLLLGGCGVGGDEAETEFDPSIPETFIRDKARADVRANPVLTVREPQDPDVQCEETDPRSDVPPPEGVTVFRCDVVVRSKSGKVLGRQRWEAAVEVDQSSRDTIVRSYRRLKTTIPRAPIA